MEEDSVTPTPLSPLDHPQPRRIEWSLFVPGSSPNSPTSLAPVIPPSPVSFSPDDPDEAEEEGEVDEVVITEDPSDDHQEEDGEEEPPIPPETLAVMSTLRQNWPFFGARIRLWQYWRRVMAREALFLRFLTEETEYCSQLDTLCTIYLEPLQTLNSTSQPQRRLLSPREFAQIFSGLRSLRQLTRGFHDSLTQTMLGVDDDHRVFHRFGLVGAEFLAIAPFIRMYKTFTAKFHRSLERLQTLRLQDEELSGVLSEMKHASRTSMGIDGLLELPSRRCIRYWEFLTEAVAVTDSEHPDYSNLVRARDQIEEVSVWVRDALEEYEEELRFEPIRRRFENWQSSSSSSSKGRKIIREGTFFRSPSSSSSSSPYHVHLFSDTLLLSTVTPANTYVICFAIPLAGIQIFTTEESPHQTSIKLNSWVFVLDTESERDDWVRAIYDEAVKIAPPPDDDIPPIEDPIAMNLTVEECVRICQDTTNPTQMLRVFSRNGALFRRRPSMRRFVISQDCERILWGSPRRATQDSSIQLGDVRDVVLGRRTPAFRRERERRQQRGGENISNWELAERLSFSLLYGEVGFDENGEWTGSTLDLVCRSERDYYVWTTALRHICRAHLLNHPLPLQTDLTEITVKVDRHNMTPTTTTPTQTFPAVKNDPEPPEVNGCSCGRRFTVFRRRHMCRRCGGVFCHRCTMNRVPLPDVGFDDPVRVCTRCFGELTTE